MGAPKRTITEYNGASNGGVNYGQLAKVAFCERSSTPFDKNSFICCIY